MRWVDTMRRETNAASPAQDERRRPKQRRKRRLTRGKATLLSLAVLLLFFLFIPPFAGCFFSPAEAIRREENGLLIGPSEIAADYPAAKPGRRVYIGRYKDWVSVYTLRRTLGIYWAVESVSTAKAVPGEPLAASSWFARQGEAGYYVYAGVRSDPAVARIELRREDGAPLIAEEFPADTFCFSWQEGAGNMKSVTVYDCSGNVLAVYGAGMERCDS